MADTFSILEFEELDSTNAYVLREFPNLDDRTAVTALRQTAGRGRLNRAWLSEGKGLYFSLAVKPRNPESFSFANLTQLLCVAARAALADSGLEPLIKWPNDLVCDGGKIGGILAEAVTGGGRVTGAALGAGLNLSQTESDFQELHYPAVSIAMLGGQVPARGELLVKTLSQFYARYPDFERHGFAAISAEYDRYFAFRGKRMVLRQDGLCVEGTAPGVDGEGRLILETAEGKRLFTTGDLLPG